MKKGFLKAAIGALALTAMMGFACASETETYSFTSDVNKTTDETAMAVVDVTGFGTVEVNFSWGEGGYGGGCVGYNSVAKGDWNGDNKYANGDTEFISIDVADVAEDEEGKKLIQIQSWWTSADPATEVEVLKCEPDVVQAYDLSSDVNKTTDETALIALDVTGYRYAQFDFSWDEGGYGGGCVGYNSVAKNDWNGDNKYANGDVESIVIDLSDVKEDEEGKKVIQIQSWWTAAEPPTHVNVTLAERTLVGLEDVTYDPETPIEITASNNFQLTEKDFSEIKVGNLSTSLHFSKDIWNPWCPAFIKVQAGSSTKYYVLAGESVNWDLTVAVDEKGEGALIIPFDPEKYSDDVPVVENFEWIKVAPGEDVDLTFEIGGKATWSVTFYSLAWNNNDATVDDPDGTLKELPVKNDAGEDITEKYVYTIGIPVAEEEEEPIVDPNGDKEETTPTPTPTEKPVEKQENKATESAKTGDATSVAVLSVVALLALAGVVVTKKNRA